jgi:hypothetical protein
LKGIAAQPVRSFGGELYAACAGGVDADSPRSQSGRALWRGQLENVLFAGNGPGHLLSLPFSVRQFQFEGQFLVFGF